MLKDVNDSLEEAKQLAHLVKEFNAIVNLMFDNPSF
jgi:adenine C2-methylase RlmN of 23S rRNA A2503 and tRNA A37